MSNTQGRGTSVKSGAAQTGISLKKRTTLNRRKFMGDTLKTACGVGLLGLGMGTYSRQVESHPAWVIRPPGALPEPEFSGACIRCGLCVRDCPYDMLRLAELGESVAMGTPYFIARDKPCEMCEDIPCAAACPTNALSHELDNIDDARMGLAVLIDQEECIAFQGLRCEVCFMSARYRAMPLQLKCGITVVRVNMLCLYRWFILIVARAVVSVKKPVFLKKRQSRFYLWKLQKAW